MRARGSDGHSKRIVFDKLFPHLGEQVKAKGQVSSSNQNPTDNKPKQPKYRSGDTRGEILGKERKEKTDEQRSPQRRNMLRGTVRRTPKYSR